ncbi:NRAMP family divalent metal transporter [Fulvivirga ligni]|uniref:NRAMP family divalent metal transporter n=1 Tax=Fulvivirga ligni TaxID=2904246 RepID=UPI001F3BB3F7|nr:divalent metal cation transporter [Fulvivirga ligni]UII21909.1 divalent metal cation transporter [Fulvivirga ligni]
MKYKARLIQILFWSVISAAFIGPGTLATASAAGASYGVQLVWALIFSTLACIVLQEMAARITIVSGKHITQILAGRKIMAVIGVSVIIGCAAYEAGNILGALSGLKQLIPMADLLGVIILGILCLLILALGNVQQVTKSLGTMVAVMGVLVCLVALQLDFSHWEIQEIMPSIPSDSEWIVIGLIGTTIVPYNLFLGSGISNGHDLKGMRFGLVISVLFGGIISIAILLVGTEMSGTVSFVKLTEVVGNHLGAWAGAAMAIGLLVAGFTSSVTAPLAAGLIAKDIFKHQKAYSYGWLSVLAVGLIFGVLNIKPIPIIILAQGLNGTVLPLVAVFLVIQANNATLLKGQVNPWWLNVMAFIIIDLVMIIGLSNILGALGKISDFTLENNLNKLLILQLLSLPVLVYTIFKVNKVRTIR